MGGGILQRAISYPDRALTPIELDHYNSDPRQTTIGPVAQLGARMNGIHEVAGSIPAWSTNLRSLALL
jgi:hypothetical protein